MVKSFAIGRIGIYKGGLSAEEIINKVKNEHVSLLATFRVHYLIEGSMNFVKKARIKSFLKLAQHGSFHKISITDFEIIYGVEEFSKIAKEKELNLCPIFSEAEVSAVEKALNENEVIFQVFKHTRFKLLCFAKQAQSKSTSESPTRA